MKPKLAPQKIITLSALLVVAVFAICIYLAVSQPWLGLVLAPDVDGQGVVVAGVEGRGPASALHLGTRVLGIAGRELALTASDIVEEPDAFSRFSQYNDFMARQSRLAEALAQPRLTLLLDDGGQVVLEPQPRRPLSALPLLFWYQLVCGAIVFMAGMSVLAFRPRERVAHYYALTGFGLLLAASAAGVYSSRELAIDGELFYALSLLNQFGSLLFAGTFISILWYYPQRLHPFPFGPVFITGYFVCWLLTLFQVYDTLDAAMRYPLFVGLALNLGLAFMQWRRSRKHPVHRAILKWFLMAWLSGTTVYLGLYTIPLVLGLNAVVSQSLGWGILVTVYLGVAFGITRYRLFNLDRWVLAGWFWFLGGALVIAVDALLVSLLNLHDHLALATALALAGWLYFPLRQYLWQRLSWHSNNSIDYRELLPNLLTTVLNTRPGALQGEWEQLLQRLFLPLHIEPLGASPERVTLNEDGVSLRIPAINDIAALELTYANRGNRLFNHEDRQLAVAIHQLFCRIQEFRQAFASGVQVERRRLARDLHDDVGARLLSLVYAANDEAQADLARETLQELRSVIRNLEHKHHTFAAVLAEMRLETSGRCESRGVQLSWNQAESLSELLLDSREHSNLQRIVREAVSNALRHLQTTILHIELQHSEGMLRLMIDNDSAGTAVSAPLEVGSGMRNIRARAEELGGSAQWQFGKSSRLGGCSVVVRVAIAGSGDAE